MPYCPHCGQPYDFGQEFCRNCGTDLRLPPKASPATFPARALAPPPVVTLSPPRKSSALRNILVMLVVSILVIAVAAAALGLFGTGGDGGRETWTQYGMSIQYPSGVNTQYLGLLNQQADNASGEVEWLWNSGDTGLILLWITTNHANATTELEAIQSALLAHATNVTSTDQGNATIAGHSWEFRSYGFQYNNIAGFATFALTYYTSSGRLYALGFIDTTADTLTQLETYGASFTG